MSSITIAKAVHFLLLFLFLQKSSVMVIFNLRMTNNFSAEEEILHLNF